MVGGKINLAKLHHVLQMQKGKTGEVECLVIPIEKNNLFKGKDGNVYLDIVGFDLKDTSKGDTHLIKQSLPKDIRDKMSKEELEAMPILGNLNVNLGSGGGTPNTPSPGVTLGAEDELPF